MAKSETFTSDFDGSDVLAKDVVTITVTRQGETKEIHVNEDQFADLLEEDETLSSLYLSD